MRALSVVLAGAVLATGCVSNSYRISQPELVRLSHLPPEQKSADVRVDQEIGGETTEDAPHAEADSQIIIIPDIEVDAGGHRRARNWGGRVHGSGNVPAPHHVSSGGGTHLGGSGGSGGDGKAEAIVFLVVAAVALVAVAAVEASRFDGEVALHPMHPLHVMGRDGNELVIPFAWLDEQTANWADHAVVKDNEGPWHVIRRAPLERKWTYAMFVGEGSFTSADGSKDVGTATTVQLGVFPEQHIGVVASVFLGWRNNLENATLFESRFMGELQYLPLDAGKIHGGLYGGVGEAYRAEDGVGPDQEQSGLALSGGAMLQLELHTRIALTARFGLAKAHGEAMQDLLVGLSVY